MRDRRLFCRVDDPAEGSEPADTIEGSPQLRLEDDYQGKQPHIRARLKDHLQQLEIECYGGYVDEQKQAHTNDEPNRARPSDQAEEPVDQEGRNRYIG